MASLLDHHFPRRGNRCLASSQCHERIRHRAFSNEVDVLIAASEDSRGILEWKVTSTILAALAKRTRRLSRLGSTNCLNAFGPHIDRFAWIVYRSSPAVRDAVEIWCNHMGWKHVYSATVDAECEGICILSLNPRSLHSEATTPLSGGSQGHDRSTCFINESLQFEVSS